MDGTTVAGIRDAFYGLPLESGERKSMPYLRRQKCLSRRGGVALTRLSGSSFSGNCDNSVGPAILRP
jgi:hypothetical protein